MSSQAEIFQDEVESTPTDYLAIAGSLQTVIKEVHDRDFSLDIQQEEALVAVGNALLDGTQSGYLEMATSTGKTVVEALLAEAAVRAGKRVLFLAPTIQIAGQLIGDTADTKTGLARFSVLPDGTSVDSHFGSSKSNKSGEVVVTTYAGLVNDAKLGYRKLGQFDVVIADECHRSLGEQTSKALRTAYPNAFKIGLSATPDYAVDRKSEEVYDTSLYEFSLLEAIESGKTAPVRALLYETDEVLQLKDNRKEFTDRELAPLIDNPQRNSTALSLAETLVGEGRQGVIACIPGKSNLHARLLADLLKERGIRATSVGAHLSAEDQALRLDLYAKGHFDVITFTRALEEGWDSDKTSFAINMTPTSSPVRTKQLLGRILRKKPNGLDSVYVDFVDKKLGITKSQYTALHALELESVDMNRVLGQANPTPTGYFERNLPLLHALSPKLRARLLESQGKLLKDIAVGNRVDPLIAEWEKRLVSEGMPAEPDSNMALPAKLAQTVHRAYASWYEDNQVQPTTEELVERMGKLGPSLLQLLGEYGVRASLDVALRLDLEDTPADPLESDPSKIIEEKRLARQIALILDTLGEREAGVITMRYGLDDGIPKDLGTIGKVYGVTRERIRQIESKTMSKIRHPSRSEVLQEYHIEGIEDARARAKEKTRSQRPGEPNPYVSGFNEFKMVPSPPPLHLYKFVLSDAERSVRPHAMDDNYKHPFEWDSVIEARTQLGIHENSRAGFQTARASMRAAIHKFEATLDRLSSLPIAPSIASQQQRAATVQIYQSRVAYLHKLEQRSMELETFLERHNGLSRDQATRAEPV